ncbi:MAG: hypothetical protein ACPGEG_07575 [Salibacteraceae bacterium]
MEFIEQTTKWGLGDALQGKLMIAMGVTSLIFMFLIFKSENGILKGMLIPLGILMLIGIGYGGFLSFSRPGHVVNASEMYQTKPQLAVEQELLKAERDNKNYSIIIKVWPVSMAITALLLFFFHGDYARGLLMGLLVLFVFGLLVDTFLHQRLEPYLELLQRLNK